MSQVEVVGGSIYYEAQGEGPALVFAHGAGGNAASWWQQVPHFVGRGHRVVTFDHRGFARSPMPEAELDPARFTDDLIAILDAEGIERAVLICQSMGGWSGLGAALHHRERVRGLALCGTPGGLWIDEVQQAFVGLAERAARDFASGRAADAALAQDFPKREPELALLYGQIASFNALPPSFLARLPTVQVDPAELQGYDVPTRVVSGGKDVLFPPDVLEAVAAAIPGAVLERFPDSGHSTYFEEADRFNRVIGAFVDGLDP